MKKKGGNYNATINIQRNGIYRGFHVKRRFTSKAMH